MNYLSWHYQTVPHALLFTWRNLFIFFYHYFSISLLIKTLFVPWKRAFRVKTIQQISPNEFLERLSFNLISRIIGALIRLFVIQAGIISELFVLVGWPPLMLFWLLSFPLTFPWYLSKQAQEKRAVPVFPAEKIKTAVFLAQLLRTSFGRFVSSRLLLDPQVLITLAEPDLAIIPPPHPHPLLVPESRKLREYLFNRGITSDDLRAVYDWYFRLEEDKKDRQEIWDLDALLRIPSIGKSWAYGYTPNLDRFAIDLAQATIHQQRFIGRTKELETLERALSKKTNNSVLIVGDPGIGKHALVIRLAQLAWEGRVFPQIEGKRFIRLDVERIFEGTIDLAQRKVQLTQLLDEAESAGNVIIVIDDFDRLVASREDRMDLSDVFSHLLSKGKVQIIGLVTPPSFEQFIMPQKYITELFEVLNLNEPSQEETRIILETVSPNFEQNGTLFSYQSLESIIKLADRYIKDAPFPEKAIDLLDRASSFVANRNEKVITPAVIEQLVSEVTGVSITLSHKEKEILLSLERRIHNRIINQTEAVSAIGNALRRARTDVALRKNKPIATFLFLGPTGVGKTETGKALAESFFGNEKKMVRFDMSEFQEEESIVRFLGDFKSNKQGVFATLLRENPYSVVLLDEFEKANKNLLNVFLAGFDEGVMTDSFGKKIYLTNTIIIATTNAGSEFIRQYLQDSLKKTLKADLLDHIQTEKIFSPELLNRFDDTIVFTPLSKKNTEAILDLRLESLNKKLFEERGITLSIKPETKQLILDKGFSPTFGGRQLNRALQEVIENPLSQQILKEEIERGKVVSI